MHATIGKLVAAMNDHDLDAMVALFHPDYDSRQPVHPGRTFLGREQVRANWGAMFAGVPDLRAELIRSTEDGELNWCEWAWSGTRSDGAAVRGARGHPVPDPRRPHRRGDAVHGGPRARRRSGSRTPSSACPVLGPAIRLTGLNLIGADAAEPTVTDAAAASAYAFSSSAITIFFWRIMTCICSGRCVSSPMFAGMTCQLTPKRSLHQPHCSDSGTCESFDQ